jgi:hypothetical protein
MTHDNSVNDTRLSDFMGTVRELGRDAAAGKDSLPNLAVAFTRAICDGVIDVAKDATGDDGAARVFKTYAAAEGKKAIHDRTEAGLKANISKMRQIQNAANNPKWDFVDVLNRAHTIRQQARADDIDVKPAYAGFVDVAREQLKHDEALDDAMIFATVTKTVSEKEVTLEGQLKKASKILEDIITGEKHPHIKDQSPEILAAAEQINARLAALMTVKQTEEDDKKLAEIMARRSGTAPGGMKLIAA